MNIAIHATTDPPFVEIQPTRFCAAFFGTLEAVTINGSPRFLKDSANLEPGEHWQLTADGLWFCSEDWTPLILYPFAEAKQ